MGHKIRTTDEILVDVLDVGIALSAENDRDKLFDMIIVKCMGITRCDAGTLYLCKNEKIGRAHV